MDNSFMNAGKLLGVLLCAQLISACARANDIINTPATRGQSTTDSTAVEIIAGLAEFSTFRKTPDFFDSILNNQCKKKNTVKEEDGVSSRYICSPASGLKIVDIDARQPKGEAPYVMSLRMTFSYTDYSKVKKIAQKNLGRPSRDSSSLTTWSYKTDKALNEYGNATVTITRDKELSVSVFQLGLEQGP